MLRRTPARWWSSARTVALTWAVLAGPAAWAGMPVPELLDADDPTVVEEETPQDEELTRVIDVDEDLVIAAQKVQTTVQEAPSIITVVTRRQIVERGYRTLNDVLRTVAGFEGDRWEANGWHKEAFARGLPRTVLVLINGVSIIEPVRNFVNLDRKIPLEIVERVEITSGPGGVLWGSNALLGVVNIVTRRPDESGVHAIAGYGDGPGDRRAVKAGLGLSERFGERFGLFTHLDLFTTGGPDLTVDTQKLVGALPEPSPDAATFYLPGERTTSGGGRSWFFNFAGRLELGPFALDWMVPFEREVRAIATGGAVLTHDYLRDDDGGTPTHASDSVRLVNLSYGDRFRGSDVGVKARVYFVQWQIDESPFGAFPASPLLFADTSSVFGGNTKDFHLEMTADLVARAGAAVDIDVRLTPDLTLVTGAEGIYDLNRGLVQRFFAPDSVGQCQEGFTYEPDNPYLKCRIEQTLVDDTERFIGAAFAQLDWRVVAPLRLNAGLRVQFSDAYSPALLYSGGLVWRMFDQTHLKLFTASGLRPPSFTSTDVRTTYSGASYLANPNLDVETSQSVELELNSMLLRDIGPFRDLYLRANGALTFLDNIISQPSGRFQNSAKRTIGSAEGLMRLRFEAGHELWANYTFTRVFDDDAEGGELRNFARHMGTIGGRVALLDDHIEFDLVLNVKGAMKDPNRPPVVDSTGAYSVSCARLLAQDLPADHPDARLRSACALPGLASGVWVRAGQQRTETIRPLALLDVGVRFKNLWRDLTASIFVYNLLDHRYYEPDFFQDPRLMSRPQPKPGLSIFGQVSLGL
ncbi:MAG: TonB-dependent receptor [Deltaproteobacteria bacterium]|nr:TonB-dependent receptor [Deltaproteobacteria bacterium]